MSSRACSPAMGGLLQLPALVVDRCGVDDLVAANRAGARGGPAASHLGVAVEGQRLDEVQVHLLVLDVVEGESLAGARAVPPDLVGLVQPATQGLDAFGQVLA